MSIDIQKWNYSTKKYEPYEVPTSVDLVLYKPDMESMVVCAQCFVPIKFGECYTSRTLHTHVGLGYPVCGYCYEKEREAERQAKAL